MSVNIEKVIGKEDKWKKTQGQTTYVTDETGVGQKKCKNGQTETDGDAYTKFASHVWKQNNEKKEEEEILMC